MCVCLQGPVTEADLRALIGGMQATAERVSEVVVDYLAKNQPREREEEGGERKEEGGGSGETEDTVVESLTNDYLSTMKPLQFGI